MELFIRIVNGQPFEHPILGENFRQAFPAIDTNNLPSEFACFERVNPPLLGTYEVMSPEHSTYELIDGVYKDVWHKRDMTLEEKTAKQQAEIDAFNLREQAENWSAWTLDEATCTMQPPIPRPESDENKLDAGIMTFWCGADNNWKDTPIRPNGQHKFDFLAWQWVEVA